MKLWKNLVKRARLSQTNLDNTYYFEKDFSTYKLCVKEKGKYRFYRSESSDGVFQQWETTEENIRYLLDKIACFEREVQNAKQEVDGFQAIRFGNEEQSVLYYKPLKGERYHFIFQDTENNYYNCVETVAQFLKRFSSILLRCSDVKQPEMLVDGYSSFYLSAKEQDGYLSAEIEYFCKRVTKDTVDRLNTVRETPVFFVGKQVYGEEDITEITDVKIGRKTFFNPRAPYKMSACIGGRTHTVYWTPISQTLAICCAQGEIAISSALHQRIKTLTGETEEQRKIRRLMQLDNYLYCNKHGIQKLPLEMQEKIFDALSQVSFQKLRLLPQHYLNRLTVAQLYDWMHCAGYSGDATVSAFVEELVKRRKVKNNF